MGRMKHEKGAGSICARMVAPVVLIKATDWEEIKKFLASRDYLDIRETEPIQIPTHEMGVNYDRR